MLIIDGIIYHLQSHGGITVYFNELIKGVKQKNINYRLMKFNDSQNYEKTSMDIECVDIVQARMLERYRNVKILSDSPILLHSSYYRVSNKKNVTNITTVHDFTYEKYVKGFSKTVHCWQKYHAIKNSAAVICVSENTASDLLKYCPINENKIHIIPNGVSPIYRSLEVPSMSDNKTIIFIGSRAGYKNFELSVKAISLFQGGVLNIVGGGALSRVERELLDKYLKDRYCFLGKLSDEDLNYQYNTAYALLYPSLYEGFGIPILEAMKAGCPVVAMNRSSIPEVAGVGAILIDEPKVELLIEALINVSFVKEKLIAAGFKQSEKYSWKKCVEQTTNVYNNFI
jgi:mannosyltransferase